MPATRPRQQASRLLHLPNEILFQIYSRLESLESVWALMCTSSSLWTAFHINPLYIIDCALKNGMPHFMVGLIQAVWNFRSGRMRHMSLGVMRYIDEIHCRWTLNKQVSVKFARNFIALSRKVHGFAHVILDDCLTNVRDIKDKLRPFPLLFPQISGGRLIVDPDSFLHPPTWGEEMRMIQGLWLCEFHNLLMKALRQNSPTWVAEELGELEHVTELLLEDFLGNGWAGTFWTIYRGLAVMDFPPEERATPYGEPTMLPDSIELTIPLRPGGLQLAQNCRLERILVHYDVPESIPYGRLMRDMDPETDGYQFLIGDDTALAPMASDIHRLPVCEYANLGLMHWSSERIRGLGFIYKNDCRIPKIWRPHVYDYWLAILPEGLIKRWESIQRGDKVGQRMLANCDEEESG
ncbi:hypothetical protein NLG97_g6315 [Lecanicillium saksenae]|uniref:Uncharacterized protein n=1 Tax=Lecanicillium saksenae TaxID=468837 RepID=A0ACC1QT47_9HYPO|nr:hypothetical protein NLG97_g6315 [Lecanicillium saksenae]